MAPTKILLIPLSERGQLNVSLAAASSLVSRTDVEVHLAAFAEVGPRIDDLRQQATARDAYRSPITFHPLPGPSMAEAALRSGQLTRDAIMHGLGRKEVKRASNNFMAILSPWTKEEYEAIFKSCLRVIEETEPDLVVLDAIFAPALDALKATQTPRRQVYLSPNSLKDNLGAAVRFWQFPACVHRGLCHRATFELTPQPSGLGQAIHTPCPGCPFPETSTSSSSPSPSSPFPPP